MKNREILELNQALSSLNLKGFKFSYGVAKNIALLKTEIESLQKTMVASEPFKEYEQARIALAEKYSKKDESGNPIVKGNEYEIADREVFDKELIKLQTTHKVAIEERQKQIDDFNKLLEEEAKVELYKIKLEDVPEDITTEEMTAIYVLIEE